MKIVNTLGTRKLRADFKWEKQKWKSVATPPRMKQLWKKKHKCVINQALKKKVKMHAPVDGETSSRCLLVAAVHHGVTCTRVMTRSDHGLAMMEYSRSLNEVPSSDVAEVTGPAEGICAENFNSVTDVSNESPELGSAFDIGSASSSIFTTEDSDELNNNSRSEVNMTQNSDQNACQNQENMSVMSHGLMDAATETKILGSTVFYPSALSSESSLFDSNENTSFVEEESAGNQHEQPAGASAVDSAVMTGNTFDSIPDSDLYQRIMEVITLVKAINQNNTEVSQTDNMSLVGEETMPAVTARLANAETMPAAVASFADEETLPKVIARSTDSHQIVEAVFENISSLEELASSQRIMHEESEGSQLEVMQTRPTEIQQNPPLDQQQNMQVVLEEDQRRQDNQEFSRDALTIRNQGLVLPQNLQLTWADYRELLNCGVVLRSSFTIIAQLQEFDDLNDVFLSNPRFPISTDVRINDYIDLHAERHNRWCATCFQRLRCTFSYPCGCRCNCLECAPEMRTCSVCQQPILWFEIDPQYPSL